MMEELPYLNVIGPERADTLFVSALTFYRRHEPVS